MVNLFIADDEKLVIETLQSIINWEEYDINLLGTATNGKTAFEEIMKHDIHIVIVDIRMPGMNGLELIKRVKEAKSDVIFIVCSGYSDFSYAREAMKHGSVYYLTKPVEIAELLDAVKIAIAKCNESKLYTRDQINLLKKQKMISESLIYGQYYQECDFDDFFVVSTNIKDLPDYINVLDNIIRETIGLEQFKANLLYNQDEIIILFTGNTEYSLVSQTILKITQQFKDRLNFELQWGVGANRPLAKDVHMSYIQSKKAYHYAVFMDVRISTIYDVIYSSNQKMSIDYQTIIEGLTVQDGLKQTEAYIHSFVKEALCNKVSPDVLVYHCTEIINYVTNYFKQLYSIPPEELYQHNYAGIKQLNETKSAHAMGQITYDCLDNMIHFLNDKMKDYKDKIISQIKEYIYETMNKSISAADISKVINFNPSYLSNFFKKKTGITLSDYIKEVKMEHAKLLLSNSVLKINKVAEEVGYDDQRYFCLVFKKYCGMTPSQFRDRKATNK